MPVGGTVTIATWCRVEESPGYDAMVGLRDRIVGRWAADALMAPFRIGTAAALGELLEPVRGAVRTARRPGAARFASIDDWVHTGVRGWTLDDGIDDEQFAELRRAARVELAPFTLDDGTVQFDAPAPVAIAAQSEMDMPPSTTRI